MTAKPQHRPKAVLVGDQLALDFLNSTVPAGPRTEWLADGAELLDWLEQVGAIDGGVVRSIRGGEFSGDALDAVAAEARALREWLRGFVLRHAGSELDPGALSELE